MSTIDSQRDTNGQEYEREKRRERRHSRNENKERYQMLKNVNICLLCTRSRTSLQVINLTINRENTYLIIPSKRISTRARCASIPSTYREQLVAQPRLSCLTPSLLQLASRCPGTYSAPFGNRTNEDTPFPAYFIQAKSVRLNIWFADIPLFHSECVVCFCCPLLKASEGSFRCSIYGNVLGAIMLGRCAMDGRVCWLRCLKG